MKALSHFFDGVNALFDKLHKDLDEEFLEFERQLDVAEAADLEPGTTRTVEKSVTTQGGIVTRITTTVTTVTRR